MQLNVLKFESLEQYLENDDPHIENLEQFDATPTPDYVFGSFLASTNRLVFMSAMYSPLVITRCNDPVFRFTFGTAVENLEQFDATPTPDYVFASYLGVQGVGLIMRCEEVSSLHGNAQDFFHHF